MLAQDPDEKGHSKSRAGSSCLEQASETNQQTNASGLQRQNAGVPLRAHRQCLHCDSNPGSPCYGQEAGPRRVDRWGHSWRPLLELRGRSRPFLSQILSLMDLNLDLRRLPFFRFVAQILCVFKCLSILHFDLKMWNVYWTSQLLESSCWVIYLHIWMSKHLSIWTVLMLECVN